MGTGRARVVLDASALLAWLVQEPGAEVVGGAEALAYLDCRLTSVHDFGGTYGEYVLGKVAKVFPHLFRATL